MKRETRNFARMLTTRTLLELQYINTEMEVVWGNLNVALDNVEKNDVLKKFLPAHYKCSRSTIKDQGHVVKVQDHSVT